MIAKVLVKLKDDVADPEGRAVATRLKGAGFGEVSGAKIGKYIELELESGDRENIDERIRKMCDQLLMHPHIEEFEIISVE